MYRVYIYDDITDFSRGDFMMGMNIVSAARREKAMGYICDIDQKQAVIAELLLRHALNNENATMSQIVFEPHGKPVFKDERMPHFNISHCSLGVACVVSDDRVGIDIEPYSSYSEDVAYEVFDDNELEYVLGCSKHFAELWTKKESLLKYTGEGLAGDLKSLLTKTRHLKFHTFHSSKGYACSVCSTQHKSIHPVFVSKSDLLRDARI